MNWLVFHEWRERHWLNSRQRDEPKGTCVLWMPGNGKALALEFQTAAGDAHLLDLWPVLNSERAMDDVWVRDRDGRQLAYVQNTAVIGSVVRVGHFAVEQGFENGGLGRLVAEKFFAAMRNRHGVSSVRFEENSGRYHEAGYPAFFAKLGAVAMPAASGGREAWAWSASQLAI